MKIAVASEGKMVSGHFGHCEGFNIYQAEGTEILSNEFIANPGHTPGFLPKFLHEQGVDVIISGGMGGAAIDLFNHNNIQVVTGAQGLAEENAKKFISGELKSTGSICHEHQHHHECGGH